MENKISVVVCTYNQEDTIARTLDSILMQQCHLPYEIIIGEDCSTDNTLSICQQYAEHHPGIIRVMANKPNKGVVRNYFDCLLAADGKYIADCAGDDFWTDPLKLETRDTLCAPTLFAGYCKGYGCLGNYPHPKGYECLPPELVALCCRSVQKSLRGRCLPLPQQRFCNGRHLVGIYAGTLW